MEDLSGIKKLADKNSRLLGFNNRNKVIDQINKGYCLVAENADGIIGFALYHHRKKDDITTLYSICTEEKLRGQGIGMQLIEALKEDCLKTGHTCIQLKCPEKLLSNLFYAKKGFLHVGVEEKPTQNLRIWNLSVVPGRAPCLPR